MSEAEGEEEEVLSLGTSDEADIGQEQGNEEESAAQVGCVVRNSCSIQHTRWMCQLPCPGCKLNSEFLDHQYCQHTQLIVMLAMPHAGLSRASDTELQYSGQRAA